MAPCHADVIGPFPRPPLGDLEIALTSSLDGLYFSWTLWCIALSQTWDALSVGLTHHLVRLRVHRRTGSLCEVIRAAQSCQDTRGAQKHGLPDREVGPRQKGVSASP